MKYFKLTPSLTSPSSVLLSSPSSSLSSSSVLSTQHPLIVMSSNSAANGATGIAMAANTATAVSINTTIGTAAATNGSSTVISIVHCVCLKYHVVVHILFCLCPSMSIFFNHPFLLSVRCEIAFLR